ncbi:MAG: 50S ribosomal protein L11 methyltransferase, partial [Candidatus Obscuribacterales bacterium]|nr:50S ribosomal protein L11 methyltransferase [Steroidobacteraceae bacterium]
MPFLQLTVELGAIDPAAIEDALFAVGASSVTLQDAADDPILEPGPGETPLWPTVTVHALFSANSEHSVILSALHATLGQELPVHHFEHIEDRVWEREWLKDFRPMQFGQRLWVCPGGMTPPAELLPAPQGPTLCLIHLDPGLAFGTGTHPTTALCLEWLDSADLAGQRVIDYGCGSGILAIAALQLGAHHATGIDNDPQALVATRANATRNGVQDRLHVQGVSEVPTAPAKVVLANILAGPLHELAPALSALVVPGGTLVLSGILRSQADG